MSLETLTADELIQQGTYLSKLLSYETLNWWHEFVVRGSARVAFCSMKKYNHQRFETYGRFFESEVFPEDKEGWRIIRQVYKEFVD